MSRLEDRIAALSPEERKRFEKQIDEARRRQERLGQAQTSVNQQFRRLRSAEHQLLRYSTALRGAAQSIERAAEVPAAEPEITASRLRSARERN